MKPQSMFPSKSEIKLFHGDCLEVMQGLPDSSIDCVVTDPPAGISFMGKSWDSDKGGRDAWIEWMCGVATECLRVMKPGGHALVWALPRTSHWTATAWENAGFEVRDVVHHAFGSGFPKSLDISKAIDKAAGAERTEVIATRHRNVKPFDDDNGWNSNSTSGDFEYKAPATNEAKTWEGYGTALKPAIENWILLRKPIEKGLTIAANCLKYGTGGLAIDRCRIEGKLEGDPNRFPRAYTTENSHDGWKRPSHENYTKPIVRAEGRFPANLILDSSEEVRSCFPDTKSGAGSGTGSSGMFKKSGLDGASDRLSSEGSAARFFYCAKASRSERGQNNSHPTVKPLSLIQYLCKLVSNPSAGTILDPFFGSGTLGVACEKLGIPWIGIELSEDYCEIAKARIEAETRQMSMFEKRE